MRIIGANRAVSKNTRTVRRFQSFCLMKYVLSNKEPQRTIMVNARNINAYGALFASNEKLPLNAILEMEVYLPPLKNFITTLASVKRVQKIKEREQYLIGTSFTAMDPEDRKRIDSYIGDIAKDPLMQRYLDRRPRLVTRRLT